ncbi:MAG: hypothetical protein Q4B41_09985 [Corynebacterium sp.]|nr:hypothetical protein [Corynebacterium sp.]
MLEWAGRQWDTRPLLPAAAVHVARLGSRDHTRQITGVLGLVAAAGLDAREVTAALLVCPDDGVDLLDLAAGILREGTGRPWRTTVALAGAAVGQWSMIRGRLIMRGIGDPLRDLPSLTALLDVVEAMVLDGAEDEKERRRILSDLYRRDDGLSPPVGWEDGAQLDGIL